MSLKVVSRPRRKRFYVRGTIYGQRIDESTGTENLKLAKAYRLKREHELLSEKLHGKSTVATFAQAALHYLEHGGATRFMEPVLLHFGTHRLADIGQEQIDLAARKLHPRCSGATRNRQVYSPVSAVLHHAARLGWCPQPVLRRPKASPGRVRWITKAEADALLSACNESLRPLVLFMLYTGARAGEALWLDWKNVDLQRRHVQFLRTKNGSDRGVPLHSKVVDALSELPHRQGVVFLKPDGKPYSCIDKDNDADTSAGTRIKNAFAGAVRRSGITDFHPHDCRHTWATWHYQANRDLTALMRLGGWRTMHMVMRYAHSNVDELCQTIDKM